MIISIQYLYWLAGVLLLITAGMTLADRSHPKRWSSGLFWLLFAVVFLIGDRLPSVAVGVGVVLMAVIAGLGGVGPRRSCRATCQSGPCQCRSAGS